MRRYYYKWAALVMTGATVFAFLLQCDKAALNLQRGFWYGLGDSISDLLTDPLAAAT